MNTESTPNLDSSANRLKTTVGIPAGTKVTSDDPKLTVPEAPVIEDYELVRHLGGGGMGVVYLYRNRLMDRLEVLKVLAKHLVDHPQAMERFLREIQSAAQLNHRNIVRAYSAIRWNQGLILSMEYVDGQDLAGRVEKLGPMSVAEACSCIYQAAKGLQHAALSKMVHRDIKPANLILDLTRDKGVVKILDFGLAKVTSERPVDNGLTRQGFLLGSPDYMAPEQIRSPQTADARADIYSLGCTLYYLLSGGPPFDGNSLYDILQAHHSTEANALNLLRNDVPAELAALTAKMMAKDPEHRFQTPAALAEAILPFFRSGTGAGSRPASKSGDIPAPVNPDRKGTMIEEIPLIDMAPRPLSGTSGNRARTMMETPVPEDVGPRNRARTMMETSVPNPREVAVDLANEPTPAWRQPGVLVAICVAILAVSALGVSLYALNRNRAPAPANSLVDTLKPIPPTIPNPPRKNEFQISGKDSATPPRPPATPSGIIPIPPGFPVPVNDPKGSNQKVGANESDLAFMKHTATTPDRVEPSPKSSTDVVNPKANMKTNLSKSGIQPGPDGYVRVDYTDLIASPQKYEGVRVIPNRFLQISSLYFDRDKDVPGYATLVVKDINDATMTTEYGKSKNGGPSFVLDRRLARTFGEFWAESFLKPQIVADVKIVPTLELKPSKVDGTNGWIAVIIAMEVKTSEDFTKVVARDFDDAFEIYRVIPGRYGTISGHGQEWLDRLGGDNEIKRAKFWLNKWDKDARSNLRKGQVNKMMQMITVEGMRAGSQQQQNMMMRARQFQQNGR